MNKPVGPLRVEHEAHAGPARFTTAEFLRMAEGGAFDDMKVELVDGRLERMTPPMSNHSKRQSETFGALWLALRGKASVARVEIGVKVEEDTVIACDIAVVRSDPDANRVLDPAEILLVVEVAETTMVRDTGLKRLKYAQAGIPLYWVVDGARSVVHVYAEPVDGDYAQINTVRFGEPLPVPGTDETISLG